MTFKELLSNDVLALPVINHESKYFTELIAGVLDEYLKTVESLDNTDLGLPYTQQPWAIKGIQKLFIEGLVETIRLYLDGEPAKAYEHFSKALEIFNPFHLNIRTYEEKEPFYRIRLNDSNYLFSRVEMFHIPFEKRGTVKTQRYSIPGFPSLYVSRTIYLCWEELKRPDLNKFQAAKITNNRPVKCLDLVPIKYEGGDITELDYRYLVTWPLIACCSVRVQNPNDSFKPEYIIPQLLLQWVRNTPEIDGIRYYSTNTPKSHYLLSGDYSNLVFPVKKVDNVGFCTELKSLFDMTDPISWQLHKIASDGPGFVTLGFRGEYDYLNQKIPTVEIVPGRATSYSGTALGHMEHILNQMAPYTL